MDSYQWNEYYLILAAAVLPAVASEFDAYLPHLLIKFVNVLTVGVITTLAFVREPRK
jgi:hypothetical protein